MGLPWSFALLPRSDWRRPVTLVAVSMALGPVLLTLIMFFIGTFGHWDVSLILAISALVAAIGAVIAWRRRGSGVSPTQDEVDKPSTLSAIDMALILAIAVAVILRFWNTAYWPFTTYDALWVYGSNARLFLLEGNIPARIGYYPQHIPLAYTFAQLLWGGINDHAARVVIPWFALAGILATYVLGGRLFNRRVGLLAAAMWALYPHHAAWSQFGDLEVTVTLYFTATAAFFALGWRDKQPRYLIVSGLMLGAALWTKPTAGALIQSVALLGAGGVVACWFAARRGNSAACPWRELPRAALISLVAAFPIGGVWYIRNVLLGHDPIVLPAGYWQAAAQRSGQELGWPLLILAALALILWLRRGATGRRLAGAAVGVALFSIGALPSAFGGRLPGVDELAVMLAGQIPVGIAPTRLGIVEYTLIGIGAALVLWAAWPAGRSLSTAWRGVLVILLAFIAPYFATWFWSYSYHFRLSFPIVPLLITLLAALVGYAFSGLRATRVRIIAGVTLVLALAVPGWWAVLTALEPAATGALATDDIKIARGNPALMALVGFLRTEREKLGRPLRIVAPGELRLSFFFPQDDIQGDAFPLWLDDIADVDFYIDSSVSQKLYDIRGELFNQIVASRTRAEVMQRVFTTDDGNFRFSAYTIDNAARFVPPIAQWPPGCSAWRCRPPGGL